MKDAKYLKWIRQQKCCCGGKTEGCNMEPCEPHHCGDWGSAKRNHDEDCIPVTRLCHGQMEDYKHIYSREKQRELAKEYYKKYKESL
jgi:hypothetical protein